MASLIFDPLYYVEGRCFKFLGGSKAPAAPDPTKTAAAQTAQNKETALWSAQLNNVNQITPYGNLTYAQTGGGKQYNMDAYSKALESYNKNLSSSGGASPWRALTDRAGVYYNQETGKTQYFGKNAPTGSGSSYASSAPKLDQFLIGDSAPQFTSTVTLNPQSQAILDAQLASERGLAELGNEQIGRISQSVSNPYSYEGLPSVYGEGDTALARTKAEEAIMSRMNPQFAQDEESLRTRLINQGIGQGSEAYRREMNQFGQTKTDARQQAVLRGQDYANSLLNESLTRRNQAIQEYDTQRNAPLNEYIGMTSGTQIQNPQFSSRDMGSIPNSNYTDLVNQQYQSQVNSYNQGQASKNSLTSGLFGLGGSFLGSQAGSTALAGLFAASDARLKENIEDFGEENGHKTYKFNYKNDNKKYVGVMADDVIKTHPEAVIMVDGYMAVDYNRIGVNFREVE